MRRIICYIDMLGRGGAQRVMSNLVSHFHAVGDDVTLVNNYPRDEKLPHYEVPSGVQRLYLRNKRTGIPGVLHLQRVIRLRKILKKEKPDLLLSFLGTPNIISLIACIGLKTKVIVSVRNDPNREYGSFWLKKWAVNVLFRRANGCVFQTKDASLYFKKKVRDKARVIFNPVDERFFEVQRTQKTQDIVTFGRMEAQKNHKMLIDAYSMLPESLRKDRLIIYGDGPLKGEMTQYVKEIGVEEFVDFPGNVADVDKRLEKARLFVLSSDYEGLPNALMEAMAVGVPCISTDCPCGGPKSLITDADQGYLVLCNDTVGLRDAMIKVLTDPKKLEKMSCCAKARARDFMPSKIYLEWEIYFDKIINS